MEPIAIHLLVTVDVHAPVITGEVLRVGDEAGSGTVGGFSGHLGLITAIERAIDAAVAERPPPEAPPLRMELGNVVLGPTSA